MYNLENVLSSYKSEQNNIRILESSKLTDGGRFINLIEDNNKAITIRYVYYGKVPETMTETGKKSHEFYCPVCIVWNTDELFNKELVTEMYPFDPEAVTAIYKENSNYKLDVSKESIVKYIVKFYDSNENYVEERPLRIDEGELVIVELNEMHNPNIIDKGWTKDRYEPKRTTVTLRVNDIELCSQIFDAYKDCIKAIIVPEKIMEFEAMERIKGKVEVYTYKTNPYRAPNYYVRDVEQIFRNIINGIGGKNL